MAALANACTPIGAVHRSDHDPVVASARDAQVDPTIASGKGESATNGASCPVEGARACAGLASRVPLLCEGGVWHERTECEDDERCDSAAGPEQGRCRPIAEECLNRTPGVLFCDAMQRRRVCLDLVAAVERPCGALERCVGEGDRVHCACVPGAVDQNDGCTIASACDKDNGGCDPLTSCTLEQGKRVCGACPSGFSGTGLTGCAPLPTAIELSAGTLAPAFDPAIHEYTVTLPFLVQTVEARVRGPAQTSLELNGARTAYGAQWRSQPLGLGDNMLQVVLRSQFGVTSEYKLTLKHAALRESGLLKASDAATTDTFGYSVALSGDTLAVGAVYADGAVTNSGAVYVFVRRGEHWVQQAIVQPNPPLAEECFGTSVAVLGDTLAVGAINDMPCSPANPTRGGAVYIFAREGEAWSQKAMLLANNGAPRDGFGSAVALAGDTLVVGAMFADDVMRNAGSAQIFSRRTGAWTWSQTLTAEQPTSEAQFGVAVALEADTLAISAWNESMEADRGGAVYVFERDADRWSRRIRLQPSAAEAGAGFGYALALLGDRLAIGAPHYDRFADVPRGQVFLFERMTGAFRPSAVLQAPKAHNNDWFGYSVGLSRDLLAVGAGGDSSGSRGLDGDPTRTDAPGSGAVHVFGLAADRQWKPTAYVKASNADANDVLGCAIAMSETEIVATANLEASSAQGAGKDNLAPASGAVYVFR